MRQPAVDQSRRHEQVVREIEDTGGRAWSAFVTGAGPTNRRGLHRLARGRGGWPLGVPRQARRVEQGTTEAGSLRLRPFTVGDIDRVRHVQG